MEREHINAAFDEELDELKQKLLDMADCALRMLDYSVKALVDRNSSLVESVIAMDREVDAAEVSIDAFCLELLARRQPAARDLRLITSALKIVTNLERVGDKCVNIAKRAHELNDDHVFIEPYIEIPRMGHWTEVMVREAMDAFVCGNTELAGKVNRDRKFVDDLNDRVQRVLLTYILENPASSPQIMKINYISRALDRIADHATNIAKIVTFMVEGKDIRHSQVDGGIRFNREK